MYFWKAWPMVEHMMPVETKASDIAVVLRGDGLWNTLKTLRCKNQAVAYFSRSTMNETEWLNLGE